MKTLINFSALVIAIASFTLSSCTPQDQVMPEAPAANLSLPSTPAVSESATAKPLSLAKDNFGSLPVDIPTAGSYLAQEMYSTSEDGSVEPRTYWVDFYRDPQQKMYFQLAGIAEVADLEVPLRENANGTLTLDRTSIRVNGNVYEVFGNGEFTKTGFVLEYVLFDGVMTTFAKMEVAFE